MKHSTLTIIISLFSLAATAQQDPLYSQYFNNPMLINPAFAGSNERLYAGIAYRTQWAGIAGSPTTYNVNAHMAVANNKVGIGVIGVRDQIGDIKNTTYGGTVSYRIKLSASTFSFGMQAGATNFASDPNSLKVFNIPDQNFAMYSLMKFNTGAGLLWQGERYTLGLSVPRLLPSTISQGGQRIKVYGQNYYLFGAYTFDLSESIQFKPSILLRATRGSSFSADLNLNFNFNRLYTAGIFTRQGNTYGVLVQMIMKNYRLGYVFEYPGKSSALYYNTHEITLAMSLDVLQFHNHSATGL